MFGAFAGLGQIDFTGCAAKRSDTKNATVQRNHNVLQIKHLQNVLQAVNVPKNSPPLLSLL